jgi:hypothetical protein
MGSKPRWIVVHRTMGHQSVFDIRDMSPGMLSYVIVLYATSESLGALTWIENARIRLKA